MVSMARTYISTAVRKRMLGTPLLSHSPIYSGPVECMSRYMCVDECPAIVSDAFISLEIVQQFHPVQAHAPSTEPSSCYKRNVSESNLLNGIAGSTRSLPSRVRNCAGGSARCI